MTNGAKQLDLAVNQKGLKNQKDKHGIANERRWTLNMPMRATAKALLTALVLMCLQKTAHNQCGSCNGAPPSK